MFEPTLGSHDLYFYPVTFLSLAHRNVDWHHSLNLSNNWLKKLIGLCEQEGRSRGCVNRP